MSSCRWPGLPAGMACVQLQLRPPKGLGLPSPGFGSAPAGAGVDAPNTTMTAAHIEAFAMSANGFRPASLRVDRCGLSAAMAISFGIEELARPVSARGRSRRITRPPANAE